MKKSTRIFLVLCAVALISTFSYSQQYQGNSINQSKNYTNSSFGLLTDASNAEIILAAKNQIHSLIDNIPVENLSDYGFKSKAEFDKITFDTPVEMFTLNNGKISAINTWRVPLIIDNEPRALLTVVKENNEYKAVDFGACVLAKNIYERKTQNTMGLLRVYKIYSDFLIEKTETGQQEFMPVQGGMQKCNLNYILNLIENYNTTK